jgi:hypothetical protein
LEGDKKLDFGQKQERPIPAERLLTATFTEYVASSYSGLDLSEDIERFADDAAILAALQSHGVEPTHGAERYRGWTQFLERVGYKAAV